MDMSLMCLSGFSVSLKFKTNERQQDKLILIMR